MAKRKYAGMYYTVRKTDKGWTWHLYHKYAKGSEIVQSSTDAEDEEDKYLDTEGAAMTDAIHAIQDHYE